VTTVTPVLAPVWGDLVGQERAVGVLAAAARSSEAALRGEPAEGMTHAWLFTGPPGSGRSNAARAFAAALQCPQGGCGKCDACHTVLAGTHADVAVVNTSTLSIGVKITRALVMRAAHHPAGGRWQVMIIEDADRLTDEAANALLKAIEEPTPRTVWLLCAPSLDDVLPTVRSRCRHVPLRTPPAAAVAEVLMRRDGIDESMATFAARAAQGHIGRAKRLATDEDARLRRHAVLHIPQSVGSVAAAMEAAADLVRAATEEASAATAELDAKELENLKRAMGVGQGSRQPPGYAPALKDMTKEQKARAKRSIRDSVDRALLDLASFYRDVLVVHARCEVELVNEEIRESVESVARASTPVQTLRQIDAVLAARTRVDEAMPPLLAVEAMTMALRVG
jgi:DNA polymerase III subunit delta'